MLLDPDPPFKNMKNIYFIGLSFVILNLILIIFVISPFINSIQKNAKDLIAQKSEISLLAESESNIENLKKVYQIRQKDMEKIEVSFVNPETPINFIRFLETIAVDSQAAVEISLARDQSAFENSFFLDIALQSSFPNLQKFLEKLENGSYPIEVPILNIKRGIEGRVSATLTIFVLAKD